MYHILIVEDDPDIRDLLELSFTQTGYLTTTAADGKEALEKVKAGSYDLAVLDIMLPELDGFELLPFFMEKEIPVIYVSAKGQEADRVKGLKLGAEDYLVKPFSVLELLVRAEKILERRHPAEAVIEYDTVKILEKEHRVLLQDKEIRLTPMEYALLLMFFKHPNIVFTREQLLKEVWGDEFFGETRTVDNHVAILRKKLDLSKAIVTVFRVGYKLEV
ncbi:MAG: response regulator transcription factor [Lachnospiraceae bacterium]|nr:response regulator transcription factor [Lachnospiraceae bacterium]